MRKSGNEGGEIGDDKYMYGHIVLKELEKGESAEVFSVELPQTEDQGKFWFRSCRCRQLPPQNIYGSRSPLGNAGHTPRCYWDLASWKQLRSI